MLTLHSILVEEASFSKEKKKKEKKININVFLMLVRLGYDEPWLFDK